MWVFEPLGKRRKEDTTDALPACPPQACEYPDGARVLAATTLDVRDGKVVRQVNIEAWDE